jgi:hypothetical protein
MRILSDADLHTLIINQLKINSFYAFTIFYLRMHYAARYAFLHTVIFIKNNHNIKHSKTIFPRLSIIFVDERIDSQLLYE